VTLPTDALHQLRQLTAQPALQIALVVLPALMRTIEFIKDAVDDPEGEDLGDRLWYRAIMDLVEKHGSIDDPALVLAQRILDNPADIGLSAAAALELAEEEE
jgi:phytoene/squalene synthetase